MRKYFNYSVLSYAGHLTNTKFAEKKIIFSHGNGSTRKIFLFRISSAQWRSEEYLGAKNTVPKALGYLFPVPINFPCLIIENNRASLASSVDQLIGASVHWELFQH